MDNPDENVALNPPNPISNIFGIGGSRKTVLKEPIKPPPIPEALVKNVRRIKDLRLFNTYENEESSIPEEVIDEVNDFDYFKIINMYKKEPRFSKSKVLRICIKLYGMMENFSKTSSNHLHFLNTKKARITRVYG